MPGHYEQNKKKLNRALGICTDEELPKLEQHFCEMALKKYVSFDGMRTAEIETVNELKQAQNELDNLSFTKMRDKKEKRIADKNKEISEVRGKIEKLRNDEDSLKNTTINKNQKLIFASATQDYTNAQLDFVKYITENGISYGYDDFIVQMNAKTMRKETLSPVESKALELANKVVSYRNKINVIETELQENRSQRLKLNSRESELRKELAEIERENVHREFTDKAEELKQRIKNCQDELIEIKLYTNAKKTIDSAKIFHNDSIHVTSAMNVVKDARENYLKNHNPFARFFGHIFTFMDAHKEHADYLHLKQDFLDQVENKEPGAKNTGINVTADSLQLWLHGQQGPLDELVKNGEQAKRNNLFDKNDVDYRRYDYARYSDDEMLARARDDINYLTNIYVNTGYKKLEESKNDFDENTRAKWKLDILVQIKERGEKTKDPRFEELFNALDKSPLSEQEINNALLPDSDPNKIPFRNGQFYTDGFLETYETEYLTDIRNLSEIHERIRKFRAEESPEHKNQRIAEREKNEAEKKKSEAEIEAQRRKEHPELYGEIDRCNYLLSKTIDIEETADLYARIDAEKERINKYFEQPEENTLEENSDEISVEKKDQFDNIKNDTELNPEVKNTEESHTLNNKISHPEREDDIYLY